MMGYLVEYPTVLKRIILNPNSFKDKEAREFEEVPSKFDQNCGKHAKKPPNGSLFLPYRAKPGAG
jgi:hypothetical protein